MAHPTANRLRAFLGEPQSCCLGAEACVHTVMAQAALALDAYHESLDGLKVVECGRCRGKGRVRYPLGEAVDCHHCLGTGKRLRRVSDGQAAE